MSAVRELIRAKISERSLSMKDLSMKVLGRNHAYLQQYLERSIPRVLPEDVRERLAHALGVSEQDLKEPVKGAAKLPQLPIVRNQTDGFDGPLGVRGMAECGPDGWAPFNNGDIVQYIPRPSNLLGVPDAYAVEISGTSMAPKFSPGDIAHIHPRKRLTAGCFVLVQRQPRQEGEPPLAVIKRLVRVPGEKVVLEQLNPQKTITVKIEDVVSIHRVVGSSEA